MSNSTISKSAIDFLKELAKNNNKDWFQENKTTFKSHEADLKSFFEEVKEHLNQHDEIEKMKMFRIYRDVRFSKDKTPYKTHLAASFSRLGAHLRGGYYVHIKPGESFLATGFWEPNKEDLFRIRKELEMDASDFRKVINEPSFKKIWGDIEGDGVKTAPKGFDKDHPDIDLIKMKQFIFVRKFSDKEVLSKSFISEVDQSFKAIRPYFDLMSDILTTNLNGESILD
ncbi:DUF2461 domain-containing protein [Flagellimonas nanhaiensis]|uniref:DUF2461 domain-containing protein n=1 Tax=Flagellimonas nanhaiensis TaxID=2292706 RepID=A0A371JUZ7_9FLAO|nr:DUF2461 domain-containing protein [Allomuricauda nanhaiensis]RDY61612.1 DUF2461 domain-containing protein [Allomuricauda nanhaiensis]